MTHTRAQISERLRRYGENFMPRSQGTYTPEQLDEIWRGNPIRVNGPDHIRNILQREGPRSHGLVFTKHRPTATHKPGDPLGHAYNVHNTGGIEFVDVTTPGMDPLFIAPRVEKWWFYPIQ